MTTNPTLNDFFDANMGNLWLQVDGPGTIPARLACHDLDDIDEPFGDITQRHCPSPDGNGEWIVTHVSQVAPDRVTTGITVPVGKTSDGLEQVQYPIPLYIHMSRSPDRRNFLNYDRGFRLRNSRYTSKGLSNLVMREGADQSEMSFAVSADPPLDRYFPLVLTWLVTTETQNLLAIAKNNIARPPGPAGPSMKSCEDMIIAAKSAAGPATANVLRTQDRGNTWAALAVDPLGAGEHISCAVTFPITRTTRRILVGRGLTDAGNPAEVVYSDDGGATWTNVNVGSVNGTFHSWGGSLFCLPEDMRHIWSGLSNGDIFFSSDGGQTWTEQVTPNTNAIHSIHFANENVGAFAGAANTIYKTVDGGQHWTALVGPTAKAGVIIRAVIVIDPYNIWLAYADGALYKTTSGGATAASWTAVTLPHAPTGLGDLLFINPFDGFLCGYRTISGAWYPLFGRTFDGGYTWETQLGTTAFAADPTTVTEGMNKLVVCDMNRIFAVGDVIGTTGAIATLVGQ